MQLFRRETSLAVAPYLIWMILLFVLPEGAISYAIRTIAAALALFVWFFMKRVCEEVSFSSVIWGIFVGVVVTVLWIAPEYSEIYRKWCVLGDVPSPLAPQSSPYAPENCGWSLTLLRLFGSAFIIAPAEEIFFRHFLWHVYVDSRSFVFRPLDASARLYRNYFALC